MASEQDIVLQRKDANTPSPSKVKFQLPSFQALGIANPHPDQPKALQRCISPSVAAVTPPVHLDAFHFGLDGASASNEAGLLAPIASENARSCIVATLTPPVDDAGILWATMSQSLPKRLQSGGGSATTNEQAVSDSTEAALIPLPDGDTLWYEDALSLILAEVETQQARGITTRILCHALPVPDPKGHVFAKVVGAVNESLPPRSPGWINVIHALPEHYSLANLPRSPPTTPSLPQEGEDYFSQKFFDSAVTITDYQTASPRPSRSPRPIVPPSSIEVAIVERVIPPSNLKECGTILSTDKSSILVDRLLELSPSSGHLLFIYPTRKGAKTFLKDYLNPILDPLLRSMTMIYGLSTSLCEELSRTAWTDNMLSYDDLRQGLANVCAQLSSHPSSLEAARRPTFDLIYSSTSTINPDRDVWAKQWWFAQEKSKILETVSKWTQRAQQRSSSSAALNRGVTSAELVQQLYNGITTKPYPDGLLPAEGIELGIFLIRRSA